MSITFSYNKMIRNRLPEGEKSCGMVVHKQKLTPSELLLKLKEKLVEEVLEVATDQNREALTEEMADVYEVLHHLATCAGISFSEIEAARKAKVEKRGDFSADWYVVAATFPEGHPLLDHLLAHPKKYPVVSEKSTAPLISKEVFEKKIKHLEAIFFAR